jgi:hypothetical protein
VVFVVIAVGREEMPTEPVIPTRVPFGNKLKPGGTTAVAVAFADVVADAVMGGPTGDSGGTDMDPGNPLLSVQDGRPVELNL